MRGMYKKVFRCLYRRCPPLPIPNREVKPARADGIAVTGGRVGRCLILYGSPLSADSGLSVFRGYSICIYPCSREGHAGGYAIRQYGTGAVQGGILSITLKVSLGRIVLRKYGIRAILVGYCNHDPGISSNPINPGPFPVLGPSSHPFHPGSKPPRPS